MAFKMWGMNMIPDTYQPCFAAALHIPTEVLVDLYLFKGIIAGALKHKMRSFKLGLVGVYLRQGKPLK